MAEETSAGSLVNSKCVNNYAPILNVIFTIYCLNKRSFLYFVIDTKKSL
ncbi:hypothetical protein H1P_20062 [Hyella patelloides LEGE 07179]|uniref:Uncharacterized protein n=1 Tax=Hyella patelloides LEGE 07179 TaxID=945734 RepID=A0A563VQ17_9CYAN|nr:hypothetical protein H1P_20062 [Hyella patelloides LEGE 07179]